MCQREELAQLVGATLGCRFYNAECRGSRGWGGSLSTLRAFGLGCALGVGIFGCGLRHDDVSITRTVTERIGSDPGVPQPAAALAETAGRASHTGGLAGRVGRAAPDDNPPAE